jgi:DNA-binding MarR family transcriptional regulator
MTANGSEGAEPGPWLDEQEQRVWRAHLTVWRLLNYRLGRDLQKLGLTNGDYEILVNLSEAPERRMRMTALADATLQSKSRLSHQITRMEKAGLVTRQHCPDDGRGLLTVLTEQGWETMRKVAPTHACGVRRALFDRLTPEQVAALEGVLVPLAEQLGAETSVRS